MNSELHTTNFYRKIHNFPTNKRDYQGRIKAIVREEQERAAAERASPEKWNKYFAGCSRAAHLHNNAEKYAEKTGANNFLELWKEIHQLPESFSLADKAPLAAVNAEMRTINEAIYLAKRARKEIQKVQADFYGEVFELSETELAEIEAGFHSWREDCRAGRKDWNA